MSRETKYESIESAANSGAIIVGECVADMTSCNTADDKAITHYESNRSLDTQNDFHYPDYEKHRQIAQLAEQVTEIALESETVSVKVGAETSLAITVAPENAVKTGYIKKSNNNANAWVENGALHIKGNIEGECIITLTSVSGLSQATVNATIVAN
ncbi:MAG: hypothetical protein LBM67_08475 [Lentimicrobiaceae bacterium]|jgi:hypothetical protein|nr:hypothetical protein [Lentimicrobiaceae bacterium]